MNNDIEQFWNVNSIFQWEVKKQVLWKGQFRFGILYLISKVNNLIRIDYDTFLDGGPTNVKVNIYLREIGPLDLENSVSN